MYFNSTNKELKFGGDKLLATGAMEIMEIFFNLGVLIA